MAEAADIQNHDWTVEELQRFAENTAISRGLNTNHFLAVLSTESDGWQNIQSTVPNTSGPNGREDSWGIAQINLPSHKEISREQALDPSFAIPWAADEWKAGRSARWTVWRELNEKYGNKEWPL